ncbi:MAG: ABC transporter permease [Oscillospiraceae bacterium]|nr:ABC transporter permease [Oscillospiraceae bacterium]
MKVNRNRTFYYLKEGISSIFAHSLMSFASICIIVAFLVIMGTFILLAVNINSLIGDLESENIVLAYVHENLSENDARALEPVILAIPNVTSAVFISREEALQSFIGRYDDTDRYDDVDATWFRHRFAVYVSDVAQIAETQNSLRYIREIATVNANLAIANGLVTFRTVVSWVSVIMVAVLLAISLFIMQNTIKLATFERREEISIMKMVGATNSFIRWPFIVEGFILGLIGALIAYGATWSLYGLASRSVIEFAGFFQLMPLSSNVSVPIFLLYTGIGFGVGVGGSGIALNRYLKV